MEAIPMLVGVEGAVTGQSFVITETGLRIGREPGNEVVIDDNGISRQHARVILHNGAIWVQDAGSRNGVFVNGERVPDHRQLSPGDRIAIGANIFLIGLEAPPARPPTAGAPAPRTGRPGPSAKPGWKLWPFALALLFVLFFVACVGIVGLFHPDDTSAAKEGPAYSLSTVLPPEGAPATAAGTSTPSVADALATAVGADADAQRAQLPDAPNGASVQELTERGHALYETGRLNEARTAYQMALKLDPACEICTVRISRLDAEIAAKAQAQLDAGMRYWDSMQAQQAIAAWETVLLLVPDPADPMNQRAAESLARAKGSPSSPAKIP